MKTHRCRTMRKNGVITFICDECGYIRVWDTNDKNGYPKVIQKGDTTVLHKGERDDSGVLQISKLNPN